MGSVCVGASGGGDYNSRGPQVLTVIYYMGGTQGCWRDECEGGSLRAHIAPASGPAAWDVGPARDRLLIFRSDTVLHEVLSLRTQATRLALTQWWYGVEDPGNVGAGGRAGIE